MKGRRQAGRRKVNGPEEEDPESQWLGPKAVVTVQPGGDEDLGYRGTGHRDRAEGGGD